MSEGDLIAPRSDVLAMPGYFSPLVDVDVRLNVNEAPEPPPAAFVEAVHRELDTLEFHRYPDREATALRDAIGASHGLSRDEIFPANGSNEVLQSLLLAYGGPGRAIVVFEPTYALHSHIAEVTGTRVVAGERDAQFLVAPDEVARVLGKLKAEDETSPALVFLCSPNNPTGGIESAETLAAVLDAAPGLVVVDEAYGQFAPRSALELRDQHRNLVVVRTFSKTWSLAALRLGYAIADPEVVEACFRVALPYHLDALKQAAGRVALGFDDDMQARTRRLISERERLVEGLGELAVDVIPSQANFVVFRPLGRDAGEVWSSLVDDSVLVRDVSGYLRLAGHLRVTVGTSEENDRFLKALRDALA